MVVTVEVCGSKEYSSRIFPSLFISSKFPAFSLAQNKRAPSVLSPITSKEFFSFFSIRDAVFPRVQALISESSYSFFGVQNFLTRIVFWVKVPVLSVMIIWTAPKVSTDCMRLTIAFLLAIRSEERRVGKEG